MMTVKKTNLQKVLLYFMLHLILLLLFILFFRNENIQFFNGIVFGWVLFKGLCIPEFIESLYRGTEECVNCGCIVYP